MSRAACFAIAFTSLSCARHGVLVEGADGGCKRGVAYNHEQAADAPAFEQGIGWWYDWGAVPDANAWSALNAAGVEYVPMIWTGPPNAPIDVPTLAAQIPPGAKYLLGFNEPNFGTQANLTPQQAAADWPALEQLAQMRGLKLVAPAVNYCGGNCNQTDPFQWLSDFFAACASCQIDYVAFHWYACSGGALSSMLQRFEQFGRPIWLTELACLDQNDTSLAAQQSYMAQALPILEGDVKLFRYSWFIGRSSPGSSSYDLFAAPGTLSTLGAQYVAAPGKCSF